MKTSILISFLMVFVTNPKIAQTTATNFTCNDCDGNSHNLFSELDNGKVVVLAWVMPCGPCATHAVNAYASALNYQSSHPDRVKFYLVDDFANTTCQDLNDWATNYSLGNTTMFSASAISMTDYGQIGMPKIVVVGGTNHKIFFNENSSTQGIDAAINQALLATNVELTTSILELKLFPNPSSDILNINYSLNVASTINLEIFNMIGEKVNAQKIKFTAFNGVHQTNISSFSEGVYFVKISTANRSQIIKFNVVH